VEPDRDGNATSCGIKFYYVVVSISQSMTKELFTSLPAHKRCDLLWDEGQFVETIKYYHFKSNLYALYSFFVEVFFYDGSSDIEKIEVANEDTLIKYVDHLDIGHLSGEL
jgi:hypothetical protein